MVAQERIDALVLMYLKERGASKAVSSFAKHCGLSKKDDLSSSGWSADLRTLLEKVSSEDSSTQSAAAGAPTPSSETQSENDTPSGSEGTKDSKKEKKAKKKDKTEKDSDRHGKKEKSTSKKDKKKSKKSKENEESAKEAAEDAVQAPSPAGGSEEQLSGQKRTAEDEPQLEETEERLAKKSRTPGKGTPIKFFQRVHADEVSYKDDRLMDNSYGAKGGESYGAKANADLIKVRGKGFRHEKTKKKRGTYKGGKITTESLSVRLDSDSE